MSTVIQKFLSTEHMPLLKRYMERVAATPSVMRDAYAAVLLSLYVQLRDGDALRRFIDDSIEPGGGYKWNVDDAISTCLNGAVPAACCGACMHQRWLPRLRPCLRAALMTRAATPVGRAWHASCTGIGSTTLQTELPLL